MQAYKQLVILGLLLAIFDNCSAGATEGQMNTAGKMIRDICQPKLKISDADADGIKSGIFPEDKQVKCYINCMMEMMQSMKKGKLLYESTLKQIDILIPDELKESYKIGFEKCKTVVDGIKDHCEASYALMKCLQGNIPGFIFP